MEARDGGVEYALNTRTARERARREGAGQVVGTRWPSVRKVCVVAKWVVGTCAWRGGDPQT